MRFSVKFFFLDQDAWTWGKLSALALWVDEKISDATWLCRNMIQTVSMNNLRIDMGQTGTVDG